MPADTPVRTIAKVGVIGAGTMGGGIAMNFANAGIPVKILEMKQEALDKGLATIRKNYENTMKKGKLTQEKFDQRVGLITNPTGADRALRSTIDSRLQLAANQAVAPAAAGPRRSPRRSAPPSTPAAPGSAFRGRC